jgi:hypothetical protein
MKEKGMTVPPCIEKLIRQHLQRSEKGRKRGHPLIKGSFNTKY